MTSDNAAAEAARTTARVLLEISAVNFRPEQPYILTSGRASPVYIDCRRIISFPRARRKLMQLAVDQIGRDVGFESIDAVAGGETAGIPFAAWMAELMSLPMLYVRKKPKGFGRGAQIEGHMPPGCRCLLVEDLATDGGSKVNFINALRDGDGQVKDAFVIFHYGIFPQGIETLRKLGVRLHALATWRDVLAMARDSGAIDGTRAQQVRDFLDDPEGWSAAHGGKVVA